MHVATFTLHPAVLDIGVYQGDTMSLAVALRQQTDPATWADPEVPEYEPIDLTGVIFAAQIRPRAGSMTLWAEMRVEMVDAPQGRVELVLDADESANVRRDARWDLEATFPDGSVRTLLHGAVVLTKQVTP